MTVIVLTPSKKRTDIFWNFTSRRTNTFCGKFYSIKGLVKGEKFCFRNPNLHFRHGESTSTASQKSKDLNKIPFLLQDLTLDQLEVCLPY